MCVDCDHSSVNIPWPEKGMKDADYLLAFQKIVMPIALEFAPDMVISKQTHISEMFTADIVCTINSFCWF